MKNRKKSRLKRKSRQLLQRIEKLKNEQLDTFSDYLWKQKEREITSLSFQADELRRTLWEMGVGK